MKRIDAHFIVDLEAEKVFCRKCGEECENMQLEDFRVWACFNRSCDNGFEIHHDKDGQWATHILGNVWLEDEIQEILQKAFSETSGFQNFLQEIDPDRSK
ncbi:MAG: hypothetical protein ABFD97_20100 [Syntrophobacter sp.]